MRVAILHYHLLPGGVTKVIGNIAAALAESDVRIGVICGQAPDEPPNYPVAVVEGLDYDNRVSSPLPPRELYERLREAATDLLGDLPDLWHVHNHSLAKNHILPRALRMLADNGQRLLLQIHDFPEDGRPGNYSRLAETLAGEGDAPSGELLYPQASHLHYATLNGRDLRSLREAGVPAERLHLLPNAVVMEQSAAVGNPAHPAAERLFVYPTRAIRRKNIGELLLWSLLGEGRDRYALTMAPDNPVWQPIYERWVALADELKLPVLFAASKSYPGGYDGLLRDADAAFTTSIAEGFGLAFLEPWLSGLPILGRDLPDITRDFTSEGIELPGLYDFLPVPLDWFHDKMLHARFSEELAHSFAEYGRPLPADAVDRALAAACRGGTIDFARLDEDMQAMVLRRLAVNPGDRAQFAVPFDLETSRRLLDRNRRHVEASFSLPAYGRRLMDAYVATAQSPVERVSALDPGLLLDQFLKPERFHLMLS